MQIQPIYGKLWNHDQCELMTGNAAMINDPENGEMSSKKTYYFDSALIAPYILSAYDSKKSFSDISAIRTRIK